MATTASGRGPSYGMLGRVRDPATVDTLRTVLDRCTALEATLTTLQAAALQFTGGQPISARNTRIGSVRDPQYGQDAVNLQTLIRYVQNQLAALKNQIADEQDGELSNENGPIGAGSAPPTVPLPDYFSTVQAYAAGHAAELLNSCVRSGGTWDYTDGLVAVLQGMDERVGYNGVRGDVSDLRPDSLAYYHGVLPPVSGSNDVFVVDCISCICGPEDGEACVPGPSWNNVTTSRAAGAWVPSR